MMNEDFVPFELAETLVYKGFNAPCIAHYDEGFLRYNTKYPFALTAEELLISHNSICTWVDAPTIYQVLKWLRNTKNIDIEIRTEVGMLGDKVYVPFISTYTEFTLETSPDVVRYRQKKFNPTSPLPHEIIPALTYFKEWEEAALAAIDYVIDNLI